MQSYVFYIYMLKYIYSYIYILYICILKIISFSQQLSEIGAVLKEPNS